MSRDSMKTHIGRDGVGHVPAAPHTAGFPRGKGIQVEETSKPTSRSRNHESVSALTVASPVPCFYGSEGADTATLTMDALDAPEMPTFLHVDPSLGGIGGHEFDCAMNILRAAETAGYSVALAANRRFRGGPSLPAHWPVYSVFPHSPHAKRDALHALRLEGPAVCEGNATGPDSGPTQQLRQWRLRGSNLLSLPRYLRMARCRARVRGFAAGCRRLFNSMPLQPGTEVYLATVSELDLLGLAEYVAGEPRCRLARWHLQFHDDFLEDCPSDEAHLEERWAAVRGRFEYAVSRMAGNRLHFYCPTEELADQYDRLGVAPFRCLPHPVQPALRDYGRPWGKPLRVTCAGSVRREKGYRQLRAVLDALGREPLLSGRIQVVAQVPTRKRRRLRIAATATGNDQDQVSLAVLPHPLDSHAYRDLIRQTDIGLFMYDRARYRLRCSAVLQEVLAAGRPVIVPAGCWLSRQIAEPNFRHLEAMRDRLPTVARLQADQLAWCRSGGLVEPGPLGGDGLTFTDSDAAVAQVSVPNSANELIATLHWAQDAPADGYIRLRAEQYDATGNLVGQTDTILGRRADNDHVLTLVHLKPGASRLTIRLQNAYSSVPLAVTQAEMAFLDASNASGCPAGSVGLVAAGQAEIPGLVRDIVSHYAHYRESAEAFSRWWTKQHHPATVVDMLTATPHRPSTGVCEGVSDTDKSAVIALGAPGRPG